MTEQTVNNGFGRAIGRAAGCVALATGMILMTVGVAGAQSSTYPKSNCHHNCGDSHESRYRASTTTQVTTTTLCWLEACGSSSTSAPATTTTAPATTTTQAVTTTTEPVTTTTAGQTTTTEPKTTTTESKTTTTVITSSSTTPVSVLGSTTIRTGTSAPEVTVEGTSEIRTLPMTGGSVAGLIAAGLAFLLVGGMALRMSLAKRKK